MNTYKDKYFSILGDSISTYEGYLPEGYPSHYGNGNCYYTGVYGSHDTWWRQVIEHFGARLLVNNSWSGSFVCRMKGCTVESYGCSTSRACGLGADGVEPDCIIVYIGTNDRGMGFPLVSVDAEDLSVIENAYREMLSKMRGRYPRAEILCCTFPKVTCSRDPYFSFPEVSRNGSPMSAYSELVRRVAAQQGCRVVDLEREVPGERCDTSDGLHPNYDGMRFIAKRVIEAMEESQMD